MEKKIWRKTVACGVALVHPLLEYGDVENSSCSLRRGWFGSADIGSRDGWGSDWVKSMLFGWFDVVGAGGGWAEDEVEDEATGSGAGNGSVEEEGEGSFFLVHLFLNALSKFMDGRGRVARG